MITQHTRHLCAHPMAMLVASVLLGPTSVWAGLLPGTIIVADELSKTIAVVDPATGNRTVISGAGIGTGIAFNAPEDIAIDPAGNLLVADVGLGTVFRVDPRTGDRTVVSSNFWNSPVHVGSGLEFGRLKAIEVDAAGNIWVLDSGWNSVISVDPITGDRTIISGNGVGEGGNFGNPDGFELDGRGHALVGDATRNAVHSVDLTSGNRTIVSGVGIGTGLEIESPTDIEVDASGNIILVDANRKVAMSIDPATGNRTVISSATVGSGPVFTGPTAMAIDASGDLLVMERFRSVVFTVDPITGDRTILTATPNVVCVCEGFDVGTGIPNWGLPLDVFIVPVPEPGSISLLAIACLGVVLRRLHAS